MVSRLIVLGATGMLGTAVSSAAAAGSTPTVVTARDTSRVSVGGDADVVRFDASRDPLSVLDLRPDDVVVNCVGVIKHLMRDDDRADRLRAVEINARFPYLLESAARDAGARVIQIATDCVFSGARGSYTESDPHDATDVYGQTKSLGEVPSPDVLNLRCSIIGPERDTATSLQEWVLGHPAGSTITGFVDHIWNGVTTAAFAQVVLALAAAGFDGGTQHLVPADSVTKAELCRLILAAHDRDDVRVQDVESAHAIDRSLSTDHPDRNSAIWSVAGWDSAPTIADMVDAAAPDEHDEESS